MKEVIIRISEGRLRKLKKLCDIEINDEALIYIALEVYEQTRSNDEISNLMDEKGKLVKKINGQHCQIQRLHKKPEKLIDAHEKGDMT